MGEGAASDSTSAANDRLCSGVVLDRPLHLLRSRHRYATAVELGPPLLAAVHVTPPAQNRRSVRWLIPCNNCHQTTAALHPTVSAHGPAADHECCRNRVQPRFGQTLERLNDWQQQQRDWRIMYQEDEYDPLYEEVRCCIAQRGTANSLNPTLLISINAAH